MQVLKVVAEGMTTSFRYPHFMLQVHPTYEMPPPATIYGHIASALGRWFDPKEVHFAYHFSYRAKVNDLEHIILLTLSSGRLKGSSYPKVLEGQVNPFQRAILFQPRLILYLDRPDWLPFFQSPAYPVVLGRSQDLFTYTNLALVELQSATEAYFEHTLLPYSTNRFTNRGYAVLMPRWIDYQQKRRPTFERYFVVHERVQYPQDFLWFGEVQQTAVWIDPTSPMVNGRYLGLIFHAFLDEDGERNTLS